MKHGHRFLIGALVVVALAAALALIAGGGQGALAAPGIIYVDADAGGANDGSSWDDAYTDLQNALAAAASGEEIWVAEGTYKPTNGTDRYASFQMVNGVAIYGGFDPGGGAFRFKDRDWVTYVTILSGDIGIAGDRSDNVYHVFYHPAGTDLDGSATLDGFTVRDGNANGGAWPHWDGGGMYNDASSPVLTNCTFEGNSSTYGGGGMSNWAFSSPVLTNCTFEGNWSSASGGGMFNDSSSPVLINCTFSGNWAEDSGGGMLNTWNSPAELINCTFEGNSANQNGGGMFNYNSSPTLTDCSFADNSADQGGGIWNGYSSSPTLTNCTFSGNMAIYGGGMNNRDGASPTVTNCIFSGNQATIGGGMNNQQSYMVATNCTFSGNSAHYGGGMHNVYAAPVVTNCTFSGNSATYGGGMNNWYASPVMTNCILWGDTPEEIVSGGDSEPVVTYSDIEGGYSGDGNIDADPLYVDVANGDLHLDPGSPCIDVGNYAAPYLPSHDFEGDIRILDGDGDGTAIVDMGVDEVVHSGPSVVEVEIDIKPDSYPNSISLGSRGVLPVAILTTADFDASTVKPASVLFAGAASRHWTMEDVDRDGDLDLLLNFKIQELKLDESSTEATLTGETFPHAGGVFIQGTDSVRIVP